jgi:L-lactate utilization protein LutB
MSELTITEALAEIHTIDKKVEKKVEWISQLVARNEKLAINRANEATTLAVGAGPIRSIAEWLIWRREIAPHESNILRMLRNGIASVRAQAQRQGGNVVQTQDAAEPGDIVVNISEVELAREVEEHEEILGQLDGKLSLLNATTVVNVD